MLLVLLLPWAMVSEFGVAESVKLPDGLTVSVILVWCVKLPEVPVIVTVAVPIAADAEAVNVRVLDVVAVAGLKAAVTPPGKPEADKLTLALKPFCGVMAMLLPPLLPWLMVKLAGEAESEKSCAEEAGQLLTRFVALMVPMPVAKSQPMVVPYAGLNPEFEVESTPTEPSAK